MIVADTNLIAYLVTKRPPELHALAVKVYEQDAVWRAPILWRSEFMNVLALQVKVKNLSPQAAIEEMKFALELMEAGEHQTDFNAVLELAAATGASAYDCEFVSLARRLNVKLVTNDGPLLKLFPHDSVSLRAFTA